MRVRASRLGALASFAVIALAGEISRADTSYQTVDFSSGEMSFTLKLPTEAIDGDPRTFCKLDVSITGESTAFEDGESVYIEVYVDDGYFSDSTVFSSTYALTSQEISAQSFQRSIDCTGDFGTSGASSVAIYGYVDAGKGFWSSDRGASDTLTVEVITDDDGEEDDSTSAAKALGSGVTSRVCADEDWYSVTVSGSSLSLTLAFDDGSGTLDLALMNSSGTSIATGSKNAQGVYINKSGLSAGTYKVKVSPHDSTDPNIYDLSTTASSGGSSDTCSGTSSETRDCGTCGTQSRTCSSGSWGSWSTCVEGDCEDDTGDDDATDTSTSSGSNAGKVGLACTSSSTCGGLECLGSDDDDATGMFYSGYCSMSGCQADSACGDSAALCGGLFGETYCLKVCSAETDCRTGYVCARFGDDKACAPSCRSDSDCQDDALPVCDDDSGLCLATATSDASAWNGERPNADRNSQNSTIDTGGGCAETGQSSWLLVIASLLVIARIIARRVARLASSSYFTTNVKIRS